MGCVTLPRGRGSGGSLLPVAQFPRIDDASETTDIAATAKSDPTSSLGRGAQNRKTTIASAGMGTKNALAEWSPHPRTTLTLDDNRSDGTMYCFRTGDDIRPP